jgi:hypothetical protein
MHEDSRDELDERRNYEPPDLRVLATVQEATLMGTEGIVTDASFSTSPGP